MVNFNGQYFAPDKISIIECSASGDNDFPYRLTVILQDGSRYAVKYKDANQRNREAAAFARRVESEKCGIMEHIYNKLYCVEDSVKRIDKRQLRIWRQLKKLLDLQEDEGGGERYGIENP